MSTSFQLEPEVLKAAFDDELNCNRLSVNIFSPKLLLTPSECVCLEFDLAEYADSDLCTI